MVTVRLLIFGLLLLLQYSIVNAWFSCDRIPSKCDEFSASDIECEKVLSVDIRRQEHLQCGSNHKGLYFLKSEKDSTWLRASSIVCEGQVQNRWDAWYDGQKYQITASNVVCAAKHPHKGMCAQCIPLTISECDEKNGCFVGSTFNDDTTNQGCLLKSCNPRQFISINGQTGWTETHITCNNQNKWVTDNMKDISDAVCVDKISCSLAHILFDTSCAGADIESVADSVACEKPMITQDDSDPSCPTGKKLYLHDAQAMRWKLVATIKCDNKIGKWLDGDRQISETRLICASKNPSEGKMCTTEQPLKNDCTGYLDCKMVSLQDMNQLQCPANYNIYLKRGSDKYWIKATKIQCDNNNWNVKYAYGEEERDLTLTKDDRVICGTSNTTDQACPIDGDFQYAESVKYQRAPAALSGRQIGSVLTCPSGYHTYYDNGVSLGDSAICDIEGHWNSLISPLSVNQIGNTIQCRRLIQIKDVDPAKTGAVGSSWMTIVFIVVPIVIILVIGVVGVILFKRYKKKNGKERGVTSKLSSKGTPKGSSRKDSSKRSVTPQKKESHEKDFTIEGISQTGVTLDGETSRIQ